MYRVTIGRNRKFFKKYLDLPPKFRMLIIDKMQPEDRCRFTQCSKQCHKEAKSSKYFIHTLKIEIKKFTTIVAGFTKYPHDHENFVGFTWMIVESRGRKFEVMTAQGDTDSRRLDASTNLLQYSIECFKKLLLRYQNNMKVLDIFGDGLYGQDFGIERLPNIETLRTRCGKSSTLLSSKLQHPLKNLFLDGKNAENFELIYQIQGDLFLTASQLSYEDMLQLTASTITIPIAGITDKNIYDFIQSWRNGTTRQRFQRFAWHRIRESTTFDVRELFRRLGVMRIGVASTIIDIQHFQDDGKRGKLSFHNELEWSPLIFEVNTIQ